VKTGTIIITVILIALSVSVSVADALTREELEGMLERKEFKELDALAENLRTSRVRDIDGDWVLWNFYNRLTGVSETADSTEEDYIKMISLLEEWREAYPSSPTPLVALAKSYRKYALKVRGGGWASDVSKEAFALYDERLKKAWEYVSDPTARKCIRSYHEIVRIQRLISSDERFDKAVETFQEGIEKEPDYYPLYYAISGMLMERWGGKRGAIKAFLDKYSAKRGGVEGDVIYVKSLLYHNSTYDFYNFLNRIGISWDELKPRLDNMLNRLPDSPWMPNVYWYFATVAGDFKKAEQIAELMDRTNGWIPGKELYFGTRYYELAKVMFENRKHTALLTFDLSNVFDGKNKLYRECLYINSAGEVVEGSISKYMLYRDPVKFYYNNSISDFVKVIYVPPILLKEKITVKCSVINSEKGTEATASYDVEPLTYSAEEQRRIIEKCRNTNLLKNPKADEDNEYWRFKGDAGITKLGSENIFYASRMEGDEARIIQNITIPLGCDNGFAVFAGYSMMDKEIRGSITGKPVINLFKASGMGNMKIISNNNNRNDCGEKCWGPIWVIWGIEDVPYLSSQMYQGLRKGSKPVGAKAYFYDPELRIFETEEEANNFIKNYRRSHGDVTDQ
jgi:tetratricopeptide (TPR) repeat protein